MSVMEGIAVPYLLLAGGESPHTYSLRPSQVRQLHQANLLIWIGPNIETFLDKTVATISNQTRQLRLFELPHLTLLKIRKGGAWETNHSHGEKKETTPTHEELEAVHSKASEPAYQWDQHIWLDSHNAKVMVSAIAQALTQVDPEHASQYTQNANLLIQRLDKLDQHLRESLAASQNLPFLVFHDAYHYFENRYHLTAVGSITLSPEALPSAKRLQALRTHINQLQVRCIFSEPQFESSLVKTLIEGTSVRPGTLDPIGIKLAAGKEAYFELLRQLAQSLNECLLSQ
jgi:zinc transport system substrate-binding protein